MTTKLAPREMEYCALLAQGLQDKQIARVMGVTPGSIRQYAQRIRYKWNVNNRVEIVVECLKKGIVSLCVVISVAGGLEEFNRPAPRNRAQRSAKRIRMKNNSGLAMLDQLTSGFSSEYLQAYDILNNSSHFES